MKRWKRAALVTVMTVLIFALGTLSAYACSGVYVGKKASSDGSAIIARSEDQSQGIVNKRWQVVDRVENTPGRYLEVNGAGTKFDLPDTTYKYTMNQDFSGSYGDYAGCCVNENGVAVTATVSASTNKAIRAKDPLNGDVEEAMMANYIASVATSAKDGVQKLGALIAARGENEANVIMLVDKNEAWYMEMYTGHHWAAVKMPEDKVAVFGNNFMLGTDYDPNDPSSFLCSNGLFDYVKTAGEKGEDLGVYDDVGGNKKLNLAKTFGSGPKAANQTRNWGGHHFLAPSTAGVYDANKYYDLFYQPDAKVSPMDVLALMRYRLEDTNLKGQRSIATEASSQVHMLQVFSDMPAACDTLEWICLGNAEHSVFVPSWSGITDVIDTYKTSQYMNYDPDGAYWKCKRIDTLAEQNRGFLGDSVKKVFATYETMAYNKLMADKVNVQAKYASSRAEGDAYVTDKSKDMAPEFFDQADKLYEDLLYHMMWYTGKTDPPSFNALINLSYVAKSCGLNLTESGGVYTLSSGGKDYKFGVGDSFCMDGTTKVDYNPDPDQDQADYLVNALYKGDLYVPMSVVTKADLVKLSSHLS
ncbi:MAG: C69 family dipeptidase [Bacillota bacterium]|nr:C69 family dipeptidase [Bacillota bacterium]